MALREIGWDGVDWIDMAQDREQWRARVNTGCSVCTKINKNVFELWILER
jgi:hypothetical protein